MNTLKVAEPDENEEDSTCMTEEEQDILLLAAQKVIEKAGIFGVDTWSQLDWFRRMENDDIALEKRIAEALCEYDG